jgi:ABC-type multidrug transport system fused ATPase/permease subunit
MTTEVMAPIQLRRPGGGRILARCLSYLRPYWTYSAGAYLLLLINNGISLAQPLIIRSVVDQGIRGGSIRTIEQGTLNVIKLRNRLSPIGQFCRIN